MAKNFKENLTIADDRDILVIMTFDPVLTSTLSDLSVNLSAGYLGAAFITPGISRKPTAKRLMLLTTFIVTGTMWLTVAYALRKII